MKDLTWLVVAIVVAVAVCPASATESDDASPRGEITVGKRGFPAYAHVGDTINYEMWVENPNTSYDLRVDWTWDYLAPGTPDEVDTEPVVPPALPYVLTPLGTPGARQNYSFAAVVTEDMLVPHPDEPGVYAVVNTFGARGQNLYDPFPENCQGEVDAIITILNPCIRVHKDVDCNKSKEGDEVTYTICVVNCGDTDLENLIVDDTLLDLSGLFPTTIAVGESLCVDVPYTIPVGAPDPLINEVAASAEDRTGYAVSDTDFAEVDLVHPGFSLTKECLTPEVLPGGNAEFEVRIENTGDCDLVITTTEPEFTGPFMLLEGETFVSDPIVRTDPGGVDCVYNDLWAYWTLPADQYPCVMTNKDSLWAEACCDIVHPCIRVHKDVDCDKSKEGDEVTYTICVVNCGEVPLYDLEVTDTILDLTGLFPTSIAVGESLCVDVPYTIPVGAPDPLVNEVTARAYDVAGGTWTDMDTAEVDLVHPDFHVSVDCLTDPVPAGDNAEFEITINNTGDCDLVVTTNPGITPPPGTIPAHGSATGTATVPDPGGVDEICLDLMAYWTLPANQYPCEMTNTDSLPGHACCEVESGNARWTGGGTIDWAATIPEGAHVTHGFEFHCDLRKPNRLEVNWTGGNRWHMMELLSADCLMNPELPPPDPPVAPVNEVFAVGEGRYNNHRGYIAEFHFTDVGEPGVNDFASITITAPDGTIVLQAEGHLEVGNHQAHTDNRGGDSDWHDEFLQLPNPEEEWSSAEELPTEVSVSQSAPNPFRDTARIQFQLPTSGSVTIDVYDVAGRHVVTLMDEEKLAGYYEAVWDGRNSAGTPVPAGVYFYRVRLGDETLMRKMILVR